MHTLVPAFLLDQMARGHGRGSFSAVALFVDTSGFTPLTTALMQHGTEGAEIVAGVLDAVFSPLVEIIYAHGGFVAGFAGDAFKAVFPAANKDAHRRAVLAAWRIRRHVATHPRQTTRFGRFTFKVKLCVADGIVEWNVWQTHEPHAAQRATYVFAGSALAACLAADPVATAGDVVVTKAVYDQVRAWGVEATPVAAYWRLVRVPRARTPRPQAHTEEAGHDSALATLFFPQQALNPHARGEFRRVVTLFINLQSLPDGDDPFVADLFHLLARDGGFLCRVGQIGDRDQGATLLLFWGAPTSYEHDVVRALHFVIDLLAAAPMPMRAGITTNLAYAGFVGSRVREEYTCYGSHVNLAARQMVMAAWGDIWLDDATAHLAGDGFVIASHERVRFKGFAEQRPVSRLLGRQSSVAATLYSAAMVGRQQELINIWQAIAPIAAGRFGGVAVITGEAGIGKSRLVYEVQQWLMRDLGADSAFAPQWFLAQTDELMRQWLDPFRYWLRTYFGQSSAADDAANKHAFNAKLDDLLAALQMRRGDQRTSIIDHLQSELERTRSFLGALINLHWPNSLYAQLEPELRFENTLGALKTLILAESLRQPLVLHIEDAQWLDADSRTFLVRLTQRVDAFPFAVVITMRPPTEADHAELVPPSVRQTTISLQVLETGEIAALAVDVLGGFVAAELVALVQARAEGNPFFAEQLLHYLQEHSALERGETGWRLRDDPSHAAIVPANARAVLIARLDRLSQTVKEVVQTAAVLGREFAVLVLSHMVRDPASLPTQLQTAENNAIWAALSQMQYLFKHALLRDAAYDMQLRARLRALHQLAAESMQQLFAADLGPHYATLAYHTEQAGLLAEATQWYKQAGEQDAAQYANHSAIAHFTRALALTPEHDQAIRRTLLLARVDVLNILGDRPAEQRDLALLQALAAHDGEPRFQAQVAARQMEHAWGTSEYAEVEALAPVAIALAQTADDAQSEGRSRYVWGVTLRYQGVYDAALTQFGQARQIALASGDRRAEAYALLGLGSVAREQSDYGTAMEKYTQVLDIARAIGEQRLEASILHGIALALSDQGHYGESEHMLHQGLRVVQAIGDRHREGKIVDLLADSATARGDLVEAEMYLTRARDILREVNDRDAEAWVFDNLSDISCYQGRHTEALAYLEQSRALLLATGQRVIASFPLCHMAAINTALGDYDRAQAQLDEALEQCRSIRHQWTEGEALVTLTVLAYAQGDDERTLRYGHQAVTVNQISHNRSEELSAHVFLGHALTRMGDLEAAAASYHQVLARTREWYGEAKPDMFCLTGVLHARAGLAHLALMHHQLVAAASYLDDLVPYLPNAQLDLRLAPQLISLICFRVLRALGDPRAEHVVTAAHQRVHDQAANLADDQVRRSFLHNVAEHRELIAAFAQLG